MGLEGWSEVPEGYAASFEWKHAPTWLRILGSLPYADRFAFPVMVKKGLGVLTPHPGEEARDPTSVRARGWRVERGDLR